MAFSYVQSNNAYQTTASATVSVTPTGNVTAGNLLFVGGYYSTGSTETATIANTGTAGAVTWNALAKFATSGTSNVLDYFMWWGIAPASGTMIPTITFSVSNSARGIAFGEWADGPGEIITGIAGTVVQNNISTATVTLAGGAITPTSASNLILAFHKGGGTVSALAAGWTDRTFNATAFFGIADRFPGSVTAQTFSSTQTSSRGGVQEIQFTLANALSATCTFAASVVTGGGAGGAPVHLQSNSSDPNTSSSSRTCVFSSAQTAGSANVVHIFAGGSSLTINTPTDTKGNTYVLANSSFLGSPINRMWTYVSVNIASATAGANTVTINSTSGAVTAWGCAIGEYGPCAATDGSNVGTGSSTGPATSGNITTTFANDTLVATGFCVNLAPTGAGSGYTQRVLTTNNDILSEDKTVSATGTYNATYPVSGTTDWNIIITALKGSAGGGGAAGAGLGMTNRLTATAKATGQHSAALTVTGVSTKALAATCTARGSITAVLAATKPLVASDTIRGSITATLAASKVLSATDTIRALNTANLAATKLLAATVAFRGVHTANLAATKRLVTSCAIKGSIAATLAASKVLAATCTGRFVSSAALVQTQKLAASATGRLVAQGILTIRGPLSGGCTWRTAITATLAALVKTLAGPDTVRANHSATLTVARQLTATAQFRAANIAQFGATKLFAAVCTARGSISAAVAAKKLVAANAVARGNITASLTVARPLAAVVQVRAAHTATVAVTKLLAANCVGRGNNTGTISQTNVLKATNAFRAAHTALLRATKLLSATDSISLVGSASLTVRRPLAAGCVFKASSAGTLAAEQGFFAHVTARFLNSATIRVSRPLFANNVFQSVISARFGASKQHEAIAIFAVTGSATLRVSRPLAASCAIKGQESADLSMSNRVRATCIFRAASGGVLTVPSALRANVLVRTSHVANLRQTHRLIASCAVRGVETAYLKVINNLLATCTVQTVIRAGIQHGDVQAGVFCIVKAAGSGSLIVGRPLQVGAYAFWRSTPSLTVVVTRHLAAWCSWETNLSGILQGSLAGPFTFRTAGSGSLLLEAGFSVNCTFQGTGSGALTLPIPIQTFCKIRASSFPRLANTRLVRANGIIYANTTAALSVGRQLASTGTFTLAATVPIGVTLLMEANCRIDFGVDPFLDIVTNLEGNVVMTARERAVLTVLPPAPSSPLVGAINWSVSKSRGVVNVTAQEKLFLEAICHWSAPFNKAKISTRNVLKARVTARSLSEGSFLLPELFYAGICTGRANLKGDLILIGNPIQHRNPLFKCPPIPLIGDIQQMPIQMLIAYCLIYELPTRGLTQEEMRANLKAIRWIMQGDAKMVTPGEMHILWKAYNVDTGNINVDNDVKGRFITYFLYNLFIRHNAWGVSANGTFVLQKGASHVHNSVGLCSFEVVVEDMST